MANETLSGSNEDKDFEAREKLEWELAQVAADIDEIEDNKKSLEIVIRERYELLEDMPAFEQQKIREELTLLEDSFAKLTRKSLELKQRHEIILKQLGAGHNPDRVQ